MKFLRKSESAKKAIVAGISLGLMSTITSCNYQNHSKQESQIQKDSISNISILKDTIKDIVPPPGFSESNDRKIITVPGPIEELAGVSPDLPEVDTSYMNFINKKVEIDPLDSTKVDSVEIGK